MTAPAWGASVPVSRCGLASEAPPAAFWVVGDRDGASPRLRWRVRRFCSKRSSGGTTRTCGLQLTRLTSYRLLYPAESPLGTKGFIASSSAGMASRSVVTARTTRASGVMSSSYRHSTPHVRSIQGAYFFSNPSSSESSSRFVEASLTGEPSSTRVAPSCASARRASSAPPRARRCGPSASPSRGRRSQAAT